MKHQVLILWHQRNPSIIYTRIIPKSFYSYHQQVSEVLYKISFFEYLEIDPIGNPCQRFYDFQSKVSPLWSTALHLIDWDASLAYSLRFHNGIVFIERILDNNRFFRFLLNKRKVFKGFRLESKIFAEPGNWFQGK